MDVRRWHQHYDPGVSVSLDYAETRLDQRLRDTAARYPDRPAIVFFGRTLTYRELDALADRMAGALQELGLRSGDRVSTFMPNCPQVVISYEAVWRAGGVVVPANPLYTAREFAHQARDAGSRFAICLSMMYPRVREARPDTSLEHVVVTGIKEFFPPLLRTLFTVARERKEGHRVDISGDADTSWFQDVLESASAHPVSPAGTPDDVAVLMYTGGTTGVPKGAVLTHRNLVANATQAGAWSAAAVEGAEIMLTALPLSHSYAMTVCMNHAIDRGFSQVILPDPRDLDRLLRTIAKQRPTMFPGVPALYAAITNHAKVKAGKIDLGSIKQCLSGAAGLPPEVQRRFQQLTGGRLVEGYGLSEASPVTHANPLEGADRTGSIGIPVSDTDCRVVDQETETVALAQGEAGVLCVAGPQVMSGYWNRPDETADALRTADDGTTWLHTGDIAVMDEDGFFRIVDRKKDMILAAGGLNVYPREIEDVLYEHPDVLEAAVIGVPVGATDQRAKAFVVVSEGAAIAEEEIIEFCAGRLAKFKVPKAVEFRDELPKTFVGKILRRELAEEEARKEQTASS